MGLEECQCPQSGYCQYFKQEMTYDPPNWQWCQNASPEQRASYKIDCDKKHKRKEEEKRKFLAGEYITTAKLIQDCKDLLLPQVAELNLKGIVGVPRSGMIPASMIAVWLNLPLYSVNRSGQTSILSASTNFGGSRMGNFVSREGRLLVVDDTVHGGHSIKDFKSTFNEDAFYCAVYAHPSAKHNVDFFARELRPPHLLEWNLFNSTHIEHALLDFDGIFSPNVPYDICIDEERYVEYIKNVKPFYHRIPKRKCKGIVTARLEKYRSITEDWLRRYGVDYGFLKMFPTEDEAKRDRNHVEESSSFKAEVFSKSDAHFFIESEPPEAAKIREKSGKLVVCPEEEKWSR